MSLFLVLTSHLLVSGHLLSHVVGVGVLQLLLFHDRRRANRRKVVDDHVVADGIRRLLRQRNSSRLQCNYLRTQTKDP